MVQGQNWLERLNNHPFVLSLSKDMNPSPQTVRPEPFVELRRGRAAVEGHRRELCKLVLSAPVYSQLINTTRLKKYRLRILYLIELS